VKGACRLLAELRHAPSMAVIRPQLPVRRRHPPSRRPAQEDSARRLCISFHDPHFPLRCRRAQSRLDSGRLRSTPRGARPRRSAAGQPRLTSVDVAAPLKAGWVRSRKERSIDRVPSVTAPAPDTSRRSPTWGSRSSLRWADVPCARARG